MIAEPAVGDGIAGKPGPRVIPCEEQGPVEIPLEDVLEPSGRVRLNPQIQRGDFFAVSLKAGKLSLRARGYIGYIPLTQDIVVHVRPRVPISNLTRLVNLSGTPPTPLTSIRSYATTEEWTDSLLDIYAAALIDRVETILTAGLMREYVRREEVSSFPRGRVLVHQTNQKLRPRGIRHAAAIAWFDRTADIAVNRCIRYALWVLARRYIALTSQSKHQRPLHRRLNALFAVFGDVELDHTQSFLASPEVTGQRPLPTLRAYYRDALDVSRAIIEQRAVLIESPAGPLRLPSIVLNMNYVFEAYVRNVLRIYAETNGWPETVLDGNEEGKKDLFNERPSELATPDIVVSGPDGTARLVLEVKNVPVKDLFSERDAIDQTATYALSYRTTRAVLVHPRKSSFQTAGLRLLGVIDDIEIYQYRFDLGATQIERQEELFGEAIARLLDPAAVALPV